MTKPVTQFGAAKEMNRAEIDEIAWKSILNRPKRKLSEARGKRSLNYRELNDRLKSGVDFEHAWSDFLHAFYDYRDPSFFAGLNT